MKTRIFWFFLLACLSFHGTFAQVPYPQSELRQVSRILKRPALRCPLPVPLTTDERCASYVYDMKRSAPEALRLTADSIEARLAENEYIRARLPYVKVKEAAKVRFEVEAERERLRADCISREASYLKQLADGAARPAPTGELVSLEYAWRGMAHHPYLPFKITKADGDSALVEYGGWQKTRVVLADSLLTGLEKVFLDEHLYQLASYYVMDRIDLPDIPRHQLLDGEHWSIDARFSDGTSISSSGDIRPNQNLSAIERYINQVIVPEIQKREQKNKP